MSQQLTGQNMKSLASTLTAALLLPSLVVFISALIPIHAQSQNVDSCKLVTVQTYQTINGYCNSGGYVSAVQTIEVAGSTAIQLTCKQLAISCTRAS
jgi:hypothetical protein